jgi:hypothetical protein
MYSGKIAVPPGGGGIREFIHAKNDNQNYNYYVVCLVRFYWLCLNQPNKLTRQFFNQFGSLTG